MTYRDLDKPLRKSYRDLDRESKRAPLEWDGKVLRFKKTPAVSWAVDRIDINGLWVAAQVEGWPIRDLMSLYRHIGYSLSGFMDVFNETRMKEWGKK
jgi:hypothetical protein